MENEIPSQFFGEKTKKTPMIPDFCCMTPPTWNSEVSVAKESSALGAGCYFFVVLQQIEVSFHFEKPPLLCRSTPAFLSYPSGDQLKSAKRGRSRGVNGGKNLPC